MLNCASRNMTSSDDPSYVCDILVLLVVQSSFQRAQIVHRVQSALRLVGTNRMYPPFQISTGCQQINQSIPDGANVCGRPREGVECRQNGASDRSHQDHPEMGKAGQALVHRWMS